MGAHLCNLKNGETMSMTIKAPRPIHGSEHIAGRWKNLGLIGGGTGMAPFIQIMRFLLARPDDKTVVWILSINRHEQDILMRQEIDHLAQAHPDRLKVTYSLTQPTDSWTGVKGRGTVDLACRVLPIPTVTGNDEPSDACMIMVRLAA
jgi:cytochrome-b5 reductase